MKEAATPQIVSREEWEQARAELLVHEKEHTHASDALAAARRQLPMTPLEPVTVMGSNGPVSLHEVFDGRKLLIVYHFMWRKGAPHQKQCEGCTHSQVAMTAATRPGRGWAPQRVRDEPRRLHAAGPRVRHRDP